MKVNLYIFIVCLLFISTACGEVDYVKKVQIDDPLLTKEHTLLYFDKVLFTGVTLSDFPNGKRKSQQQYVDGKKHGNDFFWYENGQIEMKRMYTYNNKTGIHKAWYNDGDPKFIYPFNSEGAYHGNVQEWYSSGQLYRDFNYVNGKEEGSQRLWTKLGG